MQASSKVDRLSLCGRITPGVGIDCLASNVGCATESSGPQVPNSQKFLFTKPLADTPPTYSGFPPRRLPASPNPLSSMGGQARRPLSGRAISAEGASIAYSGAAQAVVLCPPGPQLTINGQTGFAPARGHLGISAVDDKTTRGGEVIPRTAALEPPPPPFLRGSSGARAGRPEGKTATMTERRSAPVVDPRYLLRAATQEKDQLNGDDFALQHAELLNTRALVSSRRAVSGIDQGLSIAGCVHPCKTKDGRIERPSIKAFRRAGSAKV